MSVDTKSWLCGEAETYQVKRMGPFWLLLTGEKITGERKRLPPGQRLVRDWAVLNLGVTPKITKAKMATPCRWCSGKAFDFELGRIFWLSRSTTH